MCKDTNIMIKKNLFYASHLKVDTNYTKEISEIRYTQ